MPSLELADVTLEYEVIKPAKQPIGSVLLVHGLGCQMIQWPPALIEAFVEDGFQVVRFDNRDVGLSRLKFKPSKIRHKPVDLLRWRLGARLAASYSLADMASDAVQLLDHLGLSRVHLVGVSMGGMIAQELSIRYPQRFISQTIIMSTSGRRSVGHPKPAVLRALGSRPASSRREDLIQHLMRQWRMQQGSVYQSSDDELRANVEACIDRGLNGGGFVRQQQAIMNAPNRESRLRNVALPSLVLHGKDDPLVHCSGGKAIAKALPNSRLELIPGWGHDWPASVQPLLIGHLRQHIKQHHG